MSAERIDVLHIVAAGCPDCRTKGGLAYITIDGIAFDAQVVAKALLRNDAVAELIEAASAYANAEGLPVSVMHARLRRIRAALARIGGAA